MLFPPCGINGKYVYRADLLVGRFCRTKSAVYCRPYSTLALYWSQLYVLVCGVLLGRPRKILLETIDPPLSIIVALYVKMGLHAIRSRGGSRRSDTHVMQVCPPMDVDDPNSHLSPPLSLSLVMTPPPAPNKYTTNYQQSAGVNKVQLKRSGRAASEAQTHNLFTLPFTGLHKQHRMYAVRR